MLVYQRVNLPVNQSGLDWLLAVSLFLWHADEFSSTDVLFGRLHEGT